MVVGPAIAVTIVIVMTPLLLTFFASGRTPSSRSRWQALVPSGATPIREQEFVPPPGAATDPVVEAGGGAGIVRVASVAQLPPPSARAVPPQQSPPSRPRFSTALWRPTAAAAPWYFPGASGGTARARDQLQMRKNSGYMPRDSALPPQRATERPVLTGTSWHWGKGACPTNGCSAHGGVCVPRYGRCDCGPYAWGADCSIPVITQKICVYNDSKPWFCDKPACVERRGEMVSVAPGEPAVRCEGTPLGECKERCHGRGACSGSSRTCLCYEGFVGSTCEAAAPATCLGGCSGRGECHRGWCKCRAPFWGSDCSRGGGEGIRCRTRPCLYIYELPPRLNVLALKAEYDWRIQVPGRKFDYRMPPMFHDALIVSQHRTTFPSEADFFYVPTWDWHGSWGNPEVYYRAHRYISTTFPFWNASGGADHVWAIARDAAACATPWGSLLEELKPSILLSNWGGVTGLSGRIEERCFRPGWDLVLPGTLTHRVVANSPLWAPDAVIAAGHAKRTTTLFFTGALCWKTSTIARDLRDLANKCRRSYSEPGFLSRYSFGLRYRIFERHRDAPGFRLYASDYPPSLPQGGFHLDEEILGSKFCLCPSGTGWGMRVFHVLVLGCVPVITQHDGEHAPVAQAFEPEVLDWGDFAVVVARDQIDNLPALLASVDLPAKQAALKRVWTRLIWRGGLEEPLRSRLPAPDAFDTTIAALSARLGLGGGAAASTDGRRLEQRQDNRTSVELTRPRRRFR